MGFCHVAIYILQCIKKPGSKWSWSTSSKKKWTFSRCSFKRRLTSQTSRTSNLLSRASWGNRRHRTWAVKATSTNPRAKTPRNKLIRAASVREFRAGRTTAFVTEMGRHAIPHAGVKGAQTKNLHPRESNTLWVRWSIFHSCLLPSELIFISTYVSDFDDRPAWAFGRIRTTKKGQSDRCWDCG